MSNDSLVTAQKSDFWRLSEFEDLNIIWVSDPRSRRIFYYLVVCVAELLEDTTKLALLHARLLPCNSCNLTRRTYR